MLGPTPERRPRNQPTPIGPQFDRGRVRTGPILIVSRERRLLARLKGPLEREGYLVRRADDAADALSLCQMLPGRMSLVVVDWLDPELGADGLLADLHRVANETPLLLSEGARLSTTALAGLADRALAGLLRDLAAES